MRRAVGRARNVGVILACLALGACTSESLSPGASARVVKVIDGDTIDIRIAGRTERVRLIGIDTPETKKPGTPVQCFGPEATAELKSILAPGSEIRVTRDVEARDVYGRLLLYVETFPDGRFVNADMLSGGFARVLIIPPNTAHEQQFRRLADTARRSRVGLWNACNVTP